MSTQDLSVNVYNSWHWGLALHLSLLLGLSGRMLRCPAVLKWICTVQTKAIVSGCSNDGKSNTIM